MNVHNDSPPNDTKVTLKINTFTTRVIFHNVSSLHQKQNPLEPKLLHNYSLVTTSVTTKLFLAARRNVLQSSNSVTICQLLSVMQVYRDKMTEARIMPL